MTVQSTVQPAVQDRVVIGARIDGNPVSARAVVVNSQTSAIWLGLSQPDPNLARLRPGDPVELTFLHDGSAQVATSSFRSHLGSGRSQLLAIDWKISLEPSQKRAFLRMDVECPIEYTVVTQSDRGLAGQHGTGNTLNVSAGGLLFEVEAPIEETVSVGDGLELYLAFGDDVVMAEAEVVRVQAGQAGNQAAEPYAVPSTIIAVRFVAIDSFAQDRIVHHIFSLLRQGRQPSAPQESESPRHAATPA